MKRILLFLTTLFVLVGGINVFAADIPTGLLRFKNKRTTTAYLTSKTAGSAVGAAKTPADWSQIWYVAASGEGYTFERLFQNKELYKAIMTQMAELWYTNMKDKGEELIFNPERFQEAIVKAMDTEFAPKKDKMKSYEQTARDLVNVIAAKTIDDIDGANDVIQNAFNHLYCSPTKVALIDKKQHFNTLVSRFEVFLKKVYYLNEQKEIVSTKPGSEGKSATLADCIYQTDCLKKLKFSEDEFGKKFSEYLTMVRDWRNEQTHKAPISTEQECDAAIKVVTDMYLYVVAFGISTFTIEANMPKAEEVSLKPNDFQKAAEKDIDKQ